MLDQNNSKENILDSDLEIVISLLNKNNINYWLCHGTLLGLVREGYLLPWDHDIDFACWKNDELRSVIIKIMTEHGYKLDHDGDGYDFLIFKGDGKRTIDFNFYHDNGSGLAYSNWFISRNKIAGFILGIEHNMKRIEPKSKVLKFTYNFFIFKPYSFIVRFLKSKNLLYKSAGYSTPLEYLSEFKMLNIDGVDLVIPQRYENILEFLYGEDWRVPKKNYDWVNDSSGTIVAKK